METVEDCHWLQEDSSGVSEWSDMWQKELNPHRSIKSCPRGPVNWQQ